MEPFRSVRGGGARAWLGAAEASLLRNLVGQIMTLVEPEAREPKDPKGPPDDLAELEAMLHPPGAAQAPDDPVLARLLPDAYSDDPEAAGEFRKYTEPALRSARLCCARPVPPRPRMIRCWPGCCPTRTPMTRRPPVSSANTPNPRCAAPSTRSPGRCWTRCPRRAAASSSPRSRPWRG